jgi:hypothetical protein
LGPFSEQLNGVLAIFAGNSERNNPDPRILLLGTLACLHQAGDTPVPAIPFRDLGVSDKVQDLERDDMLLETFIDEQGKDFWGIHRKFVGDQNQYNDDLLQNEILKWIAQHVTDRMVHKKIFHHAMDAIRFTRSDSASSLESLGPIPPIGDNRFPRISTLHQLYAAYEMMMPPGVQTPLDVLGSDDVTSLGSHLIAEAQ